MMSTTDDKKDQGSFSLKEVFLNFITSENSSGEIAGAVEVLATEEITRTNFRNIRSRVLLSPSASFRDRVVGLILYYARACVKDHELTIDEKENLQLLKTLFQIEEGEFYSHRALELSDLLSQQVLRIIQDRRLEDKENLYQSDLQRIFGLSYDQYVELTQKAVKEFLEMIPKDEAQERAGELQQIRTAFLISN